MTSTAPPPAPSWRDFGDDWFTPWRFALILGALLFATFPGVVLGTQSFFYRDYGFLAYPFVHFHRECFWNGELLPLWNPYVNCGVPFLAQWNTLTLYPGSLLYLLPPLPWSLGFFCLAHWFLGGMGMYALAHRWTGNRFAASVAGLAFVFNGVTLTSHIYPNYLATFGWMPWTVLFVVRAWREGGRMLVAGAMAGAMQMLTGAPELILMTWLLLAVLAVGEVQGSKFKVQSCGSVLRRFAVVVVLITGLTAVQMLPFMDLLAQSQRDRNTGGAFWSLPAWGWANFLVPLFHCFRTSQGIYVQAGQSFYPSYYLGVGVLALAGVALWQVRERLAWLLAGVTIFCALLALGENGFLHSWLAGWLPIGVSRFPIKFIALSAFTVPLLAAMAIGWWQARPAEERAVAGKKMASVFFVLLMLIGGVAAWATTNPFPTDDVAATWQNTLARAAFLALGTWALISERHMARAQSLWLLRCGVLLVIWLDVLTHSPRQNPTIEATAFEPDVIREYLKLTPEPKLGESRVMLSPTAELAMHTRMVPDFQNDFLGQRAALWGNLSLLDGIPKVNGAATLLSKEQAEVDRVLYGAVTNEFPALMDFLGVCHVTAEGETMKWAARSNFMPLVSAGQRPIFTTPADTLQGLQGTTFDPRVEVFLHSDQRTAAGGITNQTPAKIISSQFSTHHVEVEVEAGEMSVLVIAQTYHPNWRSSVDAGKSIPVWRANHAFQACMVPRGRHRVRLEFADSRVRIGFCVSAGTAALCLVGWIWGMKAAYRRSDSDPKPLAQRE